MVFASLSGCAKKDETTQTTTKETTAATTAATDTTDAPDATDDTSESTTDMTLLPTASPTPYPTLAPTPVFTKMVAYRDPEYPDDFDSFENKLTSEENPHELEIYDKKGNILQHDFYMGPMMTTDTFEYDENGLLKSKFSHTPQNGIPDYDVSYTYEYDEKGRLVKETSDSSMGEEVNSSFWNVYIYNDDGQMIEEQWWDNYEGKDAMSTRITYEYDDQGKCIIEHREEFCIEDDGSRDKENTLRLVQDVKYIYKSGKLVQENVYDELGELRSSTKYEYDDKGRMVKETEGMYDNSNPYIVYEYDDQGLLISKTQYRAKDITFETQEEVDKYWNLDPQDPELFEIMSREIYKYYFE